MLGVAVDERVQLGDQALVGCTGLELDERQHVVMGVGYRVEK
jgi:hypothetical protein